MPSDVPRDWESVPLGRVAKRIRRPLSGDPEHILMITSSGGFVPQSEKYSRFMAGESLKKYVELHRGEFAYNKGNSKTYPQGCVFRLDGWEKAAVPNVYFSFAVNQKQIAPDFASQFFVAGGLNSQLKNVITSGARGNGLLNVSPEDFFNCHIPLPPLAEQRKIAAILTSVDEAIQATEAVIAQTRRVKEGLLQELLTKGIGHTRFKQTEIGEIPETWEVKRLEDMSALITKGESPKWQGFEYQSDGMAFITSQNVQDAAMDLRDVKYLSLEFHRKIGRSSLCKGDLLVNIVGASIGRAAIWEGQLAPANVNQAVAVLRIRSGALLPELVLSQFLSNRGQDYFGLSKVDSARPNVSLGNLRSFPVVVPPIAEQLDIALRIDSLEVTLRESISQSTALQQLKSGLLQDLLTGRVRVKNGE